MLFLLIFSLLLIATAIIDLQTRTIPPKLQVAVLLAAPLYPNWSISAGLLGAMVAGGILLLPTLAKPGAFGGGDIKLAAASGFALGATRSIAALFVAVTLSLAPCVYYSMTKKQSSFAFAPYLAAGFLLAAIL